MRPVVRGDHPVDDDGNKMAIKENRDAKGPLIDRLDEYCSYCERLIPASLAVEHVRPKSIHPHLELEWHNFLLACTNCNSCKGYKEVVLENYLWPDRDNTYLAFRYTDGVITVSPDLDDETKSLAESTLTLVGLNKPANENNPSDRRFVHRMEAWNVAHESRSDYHSSPSPALARQIVRTAKAVGFWSIWMTVFSCDKDVCQALIEEFRGTCSSCFDDDLTPKPRDGGII